MVKTTHRWHDECLRCNMSYQLHRSAPARCLARAITAIHSQRTPCHRFRRRN